MKRILIGGGSGVVGKRLGELLKKRGHEVAILSRRAELKGVDRVFQWDVGKAQLDPESIEWADVVINLAGAGVGDRKWTEAVKQEIYLSRIDGNRLLIDEIGKSKSSIECFISASAAGYYGDRESDLLKENEPAGKDFLARVCVDWEAEAAKAGALGIRWACMRIGVVLSSKGGALPKMDMTAPFGFLNHLGDGKQYVPWIQIDDLCGIFIHAIETPSVHGCYNAVAPQSCTNRELMKGIKKSRKVFGPVIGVPETILKLGMGEMSAIVLNSMRCSSERIQESGYEFSHPDLVEALDHLYSNKI